MSMLASLGREARLRRTGSPMSHALDETMIRDVADRFYGLTRDDEVIGPISSGR